MAKSKKTATATAATTESVNSVIQGDRENPIYYAFVNKQQISDGLSLSAAKKKCMVYFDDPETQLLEVRKLIDGKIQPWIIVADKRKK